MKRTIQITMSLFLAVSAWGTSCGTLAAPSACSINVGTHTFTATNFLFASGVASGGGFQYQASDIQIDIATGGGGTGLLTFTKNPNGPAPGIVFLANPGDTAAFSYTYKLTVTPNTPGTSVLTSFATDMVDSHSGTGLASIQTIRSGFGPVLVFTGSTSTGTVAISGSPSSVDMGNIISLSGNTGNASIVSYQTLFSATFTAQPSINVSNQVLLTQTGFVKNRSTGHYFTTMRITNISGSTINGPVAVDFSGFTGGVTLVTPTVPGSTAVRVTTGNLTPGSSVDVALEFSNPGNTSITYSAITFSGI